MARLSFSSDWIILMKQTTKERLSKVDDRAINLFKRYPFVGAAVFIAGIIVGAGLMGILL